MADIELKAVQKAYGPVPVIRDVDLAIREGEFCVFVGPSGCGKSTLLRMIAGLEDITDGELRVGGERVNELPPAQRGVAMVFQSYALYPHMTVAENMAFGLKVKGVDKPEIERKVKDAAGILQLSTLLDRLPKALSGGQRQRVAIGRAIVTEPRVFLFDEPLSNLDAALRVQTRLEIARLHQEHAKASMVYVTHDQVEAMTLADKIVLLHAGKLVEERGSIAQVGSPMALYHRPASLFVAEFMGSPKMNILQATLRQAEAERAIVDLAGIEVSVAVDARRAAIGSQVTLGFRPEHIGVGGVGNVRDAAPGAALPVRVRHVERLGDVSLLYVDFESAPGRAPKVLTVRQEGSVRPQVGTPLSLRLAPESLHLFDADGLAFARSIELPT